MEKTNKRGVRIIHAGIPNIEDLPGGYGLYMCADCESSQEFFLQHPFSWGSPHEPTAWERIVAWWRGIDLGR